jgi:hypothetical protein
MPPHLPEHPWPGLVRRMMGEATQIHSPIRSNNRIVLLAGERRQTADRVEGT